MAGISQEALASLQKTFGKEAVMKMSEKLDLDIDFASSGSLMLNWKLGGGYPYGRIIEIYGPESAGKTTAAIHAIAEVQKAGGVAGMVDAEHAFDPEYARKLGVNVDELVISQPDHAEQGLNIAIDMIKTGEFKVVVVDSTNALTPQAELEGEMEDNTVALQARILSKAMRKMAGIAKKNNCLVIFISQIRSKVGVIYGSPESVGVGNALKYYASQRLDIRKSTPLQNKTGEAIGHTMKIKTVKNKVSSPYKTAEVVLLYGKGYDTEGEILDLAVEMEIVNKSGAWYSYQGTKLGQGKDATLATLEDNPELRDELRELVIEGLKQQ